MLAQVAKPQEAKTQVEEQLRGSQRVPVVAGEGHGGDCWRNGWETKLSVSKPEQQKVQQKVRQIVRQVQQTRT